MNYFRINACYGEIKVLANTPGFNHLKHQNKVAVIRCLNRINYQMDFVIIINYFNVNFGFINFLKNSLVKID